MADRIGSLAYRTVGQYFAGSVLVASWLVRWRAKWWLVGGLGLYTSRRYRTPYVHIDTRGKRSRWTG